MFVIFLAFFRLRIIQIEKKKKKKFFSKILVPKLAILAQISAQKWQNDPNLFIFVSIKPFSSNMRVTLLLGPFWDRNAQISRTRIISSHIREKVLTNQPSNHYWSNSMGRGDSVTGPTYVAGYIPPYKDKRWRYFTQGDAKIATLESRSSCAQNESTGIYKWYKMVLWTAESK